MTDYEHTISRADSTRTTPDEEQDADEEGDNPEEDRPTDGDVIAAAVRRYQGQFRRATKKWK
jgi:hypothetical protein